MEMTDLHSGMKSVGLWPSGASANLSTGAIPTKSAPHSSSLSTTFFVSLHTFVPPIVHPVVQKGRYRHFADIKVTMAEVILYTDLSSQGNKKPSIRQWELEEKK
jgi:hypothetical protein